MRKRTKGRSRQADTGSPTAATLRARSEKRNQVLSQAAQDELDVESTSPTSAASPRQQRQRRQQQQQQRQQQQRHSPPPAPSTTGGTISSVAAPPPTSSSVSGSPDQRRVQKLEAGVLDLSVRELQDKDLPGVVQLVEVCEVHSLCLTHNLLQDMSMPMPSTLVYLDISHNQLTSLDMRGLSTLSSLRTLLASHNRFENMVGLDNNLVLEIIDLSHNDIETVEPLPAHRRLYELNLAFNRIGNLDNVRTMALSHMQVLHLRGNPLSLPGSHLRRKVCHMLPSVKVLDEIMQAPSPYVNLDEVGTSPARRDEVHARLTGAIVDDGRNPDESHGKKHWAKKPNVVTITRKKGLTYSTIHARQVARAAAANGGSSSSGSSSPAASAAVVAAAASTPTRALSSSLTSELERSKEKGGGGGGGKRSSRETPKKHQVSRDPPSSVAMQMTQNHIARSKSPPAVIINMPAATFEEEDEEDNNDDDEGNDDNRHGSERRQQNIRSVRARVDTRMSPAVLRRMHSSGGGSGSRSGGGRRGTTRTTSTTRNNTFSSSSSNGSNDSFSLRRKEKEKEKESSRPAWSSSSKTKKKEKESSTLSSSSSKQAAARRRRAGHGARRIDTEFDGHGMSQSLTPKTLAFASNLRGSGGDGRKKGMTTRGGGTFGRNDVVGGEQQRASSMKRRAQERSLRGGGTTTTTTTRGRLSELEREQEEETTMEGDQMENMWRTEGGVGGEGGVGVEGEEEEEMWREREMRRREREENDNGPLTYGELDAKTSEKGRGGGGGGGRGGQERKSEIGKEENEWNIILQDLINQKKKSLALLYQSLSNESESQLRMVNSHNVVEDEEVEVEEEERRRGGSSHIHIDRSGRVTTPNR